jgi:hypothetical protein
LAKGTSLKQEEQLARGYADRLVLEVLTDLYECVKPSEIAERLQSHGIGLGAVRSLLASNPAMFAYAERRWVPAARVDTEGRPFHAALVNTVARFTAPVSKDLVVTELSRRFELDAADVLDRVERIVAQDPDVLETRSGDLVATSLIFVAHDETPERAMLLNAVTEAEVSEVQKQLGDFDWLAADALMLALEKCSPVSLKGLGAAAWLALSPNDPMVAPLYDWRSFNADLLSIPGFVLAQDGKLYAESDAKKWLANVGKISDKLTPEIEIEDAAPLELKPEDIDAMVARVLNADETVTATQILEAQFEVTPTVKTFPDDLKNAIKALANHEKVWWVGGDRFRKPNSAPEFVYELPEPLKFVKSDHLQEDGDPVDAELVLDSLNQSLRQVVVHPLAMDAGDEDPIPGGRQLPQTQRLVLKTIHKELGTFPVSQFPQGWFDEKPGVQELIFIDPSGKELQVWLNMELRLLTGLFDWWLEQQTESGAIFTLTRTNKANVFEFSWLAESDPVVYISNQRMEELRDLAARAEDMSTFDILREVMSHHSKGADFIALLWEVNVVRRTSRTLLASLLSSYVCFYQRSGSSVWHYDAKKVEQGFDKSKKKFIKKD